MSGATRLGDPREPKPPPSPRQPGCNARLEGSESRRELFTNLKRSRPSSSSASSPTFNTIWCARTSAWRGNASLGWIAIASTKNKEEANLMTNGCSEHPVLPRPAGWNHSQYAVASSTYRPSCGFMKFFIEHTPVLGRRSSWRGRTSVRATGSMPLPDVETLNICRRRPSDEVRRSFAINGAS